MNNDLISREALKKALRNPNDKRYLSESIISLVFERINNAPTVEEKPQGEWIGNYDNLSQSFYWVCDKCNYKQSWGRFNHCPNCGAKMYDRTRVEEQKNES